MKLSISFKRHLHPRSIYFWIAIVLLIGVLWRTMQFWGGTSLWFDELTAALNVQSRTFPELITQSLDYNVVAPVGFLLQQKLATTLFGESDHAYRLLPWIWSLVSLLFFFLLSRKFLSGIPLLAAVILFALAVTQWRFAGIAKQYSGEVAYAIFLVWAAVLIIEGKIKHRMVWPIALAGSIAILSSLPAIPIALMLLSIILFLFFKNRLPLSKQSLTIICTCWLAATALAVLYAFLVISNTVKEDMGQYWARGYPPTNSVSSFLLWFPGKLNKELSYFLFNNWLTEAMSFLYYIPLTLLLLSIPGLVYLFRKNGFITLVLFSPLVIALALSICRILPFDNRVAMYATWPLIISGLTSILAIKEWLPVRFRIAFSTVAALAVSLPFFVTIIDRNEWPPMYSQPTQHVLRNLKKQMQPGDILYVYYRARHAVNFYGPGESITSYRLGNDYNITDGYLRDLDSLKGNKRVWFFYTQWTPKKPYPDTMKKYLGTVIGRQIGYIPDPYIKDLKGNEDMEAAAYLYDLSAPHYTK